MVPSHAAILKFIKVKELYLGRPSSGTGFHNSKCFILAVRGNDPAGGVCRMTTQKLVEIPRSAIYRFHFLFR